MKPAISRETLLLEEERKKSEGVFDVRKLMQRIWGSEEYIQLRERAILEIERDTVLNDGFARYDMSRTELRENCVKKLYRAMDITQRCATHDEKQYNEVFWSILNGTDRALGMRYFIISKLWIETIQSQGTPEQQARWIPPAQRMELQGCFGMTELGHSSFLRGAETTAIFDEKTKEFVIHSPTLTSTKIWQGFAGTTATHILVLANLFVKGKSCGIQTFLVQMRDENGTTLPGIAAGDMGPKVGLNGIDNGWIQFNHVRVPKDRMMARWAQVDDAGEFHAPPSPAIAYASTVTERVTSSIGAAISTDPAIVIAARFSLLRRQGPNDEQIIDYQTQQRRILPHLAATYAFRFAGLRLSNNWNATLSALSKGDAQHLLQNLPDIHATSCGMKAFATWWAVEAQEMARRCLGGYAFHSYSGIPSIVNDFHVMTTGGGDNIVIAQQTANFLLKSLKKALGDKTVSGSVNYLNQAKKILSDSSNPFSELQKNPKDLLNLQVLHKIFTVTTIRKLAQVAQSMTAQKDGNAFNSHLNELVETVRLHSYLYVLESFLEAIATTDDQGVKNILTKLCHLFAVDFISKNAVHFLEMQTLVTQQTQKLREMAREISLEIRPYLASLTDALHVPDIILRSSLGPFDGDIYNKFLESMQNSHNSKVIPEFWDRLIKPRLALSKL